MKHGYNNMYPKTSLKAIILLHIISPGAVAGALASHHPQEKGSCPGGHLVQFHLRLIHDLWPRDHKGQYLSSSHCRDSEQDQLEDPSEPQLRKTREQLIFNKAGLNIINANTREGVIR